MKYLWIAAVFSALPLLSPGLAHAANVDVGSRIVEMSTYSDSRGTFMSIKTDGSGSGVCAGSWLRFPNTGDAQEEHVRSVALAAFLSGKPVIVAVSTGTNCDLADYIRVTN
jgi:hypothetical protein